MKKHLLIMDDDSSVRASLQKVLTDAGYDVTVAADGQQGLEKLYQGAFDLLLLDVDMPNRDGWDVLECLEMVNPMLPVIMITGMMDQMETTMIPGVNALMEKPCDVTALLQKVSELTEQSPEERSRALELHPWVCINKPRA